MKRRQKKRAGNFINCFTKHKRISSVLSLTLLTMIFASLLLLVPDSAFQENKIISYNVWDNPKLGGVAHTITTPGVADDVWVDGDYAYIADGLSGLTIVNISNPDNVNVVSTTSLEGKYAHDVIVEGSYAFIATGGGNEYASGDGSLFIVNISDPVNPGTPVRIALVAASFSTWIQGDFAYSTTWNGPWDNNLATINITDPAAPGNPHYRAATGTACYSVVVAGDYAYTSVYLNNQIDCFNISDPNVPGSPTSVSTINNYPRDITLAGNYLFVALLNWGIEIYNVTQPGNTIILYEGGNFLAESIWVEGNFAFIAARANLYICDVSNPASPGTFINTGEGGGTGVCISGDYAYVTNGDLLVVPIGQFIHPQAPNYEDASGDAMGIDIEGHFAYLAVNDSGLAISNIANPTNPTLPIYIDTPGNAYGVDVVAHNAFVADGPAGLCVISISNQPPALLCSVALPGFSRDVVVAGDFAYVAAGTGGLCVVNATNPYNLTSLSNFTLSGEALRLCVQGNYAFVAVNASGLAFINITNPYSPEIVDYLVLDGNVQDVFIDGKFAYVAANDKGLVSLNVSNPINLGTPHYQSLSGNATGVWISGDRAYIALNDQGLAEIDVTNPLDLGIPSYLDSTGNASAVCVAGGYAFLADGPSGLGVMQVKRLWNLLSQPTFMAIPSPDYDGKIYLDWNDISGATEYVLYRESTSFQYNRSIVPLKVISGQSNCLDTISSNGTYHYRVVAGNNVKNSTFSNELVVEVIIDITPPENFSIFNPGIGWVGAHDLTVIGRFYVDFSGINTSTVQVANGTEGDLAPSNWHNVDGVYINPELTLNATNGSQGWIYAKTQIVYEGNGFSVRFRANDTVGNAGIQGIADIVLYDNSTPRDFTLLSPTDWITDTTPTVITKFNITNSGLDVSSVNFAYSKYGDLYPTCWANVSGVYQDELCTIPAADGQIGTFYALVDSIPFNQESGYLNTVRFRASNLVGTIGCQPAAESIRINNTGDHAFILGSPSSWDMGPSILTNYDAYIVYEGFTSDPFAGNGNWTNNGGGWSPNNDGYCWLESGPDLSWHDHQITYKWNLLNGINFTNALFTVDWFGDFNPFTSGQYANWEYQINGGAWSQFLNPLASKRSDFPRQVIQFDMGGAYLPPNATAFSLRINTHLHSDLTMDWWFSEINVHFVSVRLFSVIINDTGPVTNYQYQPHQVNIVFKCGVNSATYIGDFQNYRLFYRMNNPVINESANFVYSNFTVVSKTEFWMNFSIPASAYTSSGTLYYRLCSRDPTVAYGGTYWIPVRSTNVYDSINPTFNDTWDFSADNETIRVGYDLTINGTALDDGGASLKNVSLYWNDLLDYADYENYTGVVYQDLIGNRDNFSLTIPSTFLHNTSFTYFRFYVTDNVGLITASSLMYIIIHDKEGPIFVSMGLKDWQVVGNASPNFSLNIYEPNLNATWYSYDNGLNNITCGLIGTLENWASFGNGTVLITFWANDTEGNTDRRDISLRKDIIKPIILVATPLDRSTHKSAPSFSLSITEPNIALMWYTLGVAPNRYYFSSATGVIDPGGWSAIPDGDLYLRFYVQDAGGNQEMVQLIITKDSFKEESNPDELGDLWILVPIIVVGGIIVIGIMAYVNWKRKHPWSSNTKNYTPKKSKYQKKVI